MAPTPILRAKVAVHLRPRNQPSLPRARFIMNSSVRRQRPPLMKPLKSILLPLALVALAVGCKPATTPATTSSAPTPVLAVIPATEPNDYAYAQKTVYAGKMRDQAAELAREVDALTAKVERANDAAKAEARPKLEELRAKLDRLNQQLDETGAATESTWETVKTGSRKAYDELKDSVTQARQWMSEKIAP